MIRIIAVGKVKEKALQSLIADYTKRLNHYHKTVIREVDDFADTKELNYAVNKEAELIIKNLTAEDYVILLDLRGETTDSLTFAKRLENWQSHHANLTFIIGGSQGVSQKVYQRADYVWQLSPLTFPHQLVRLLLLEQLYRAATISKGQRYHK